MPKTFDPNEPRTVLGFRFQENICREISRLLPDAQVKDVRTWLKEDLQIADDQLDIEEKRHGDVTFVLGGKRYFVECCLALSPKTSIGESKRLNFVGSDKWYCLGVAEGCFNERLEDVVELMKEFDPLALDAAHMRVCFVPSLVLRQYLGSCPLEESNGWRRRKLGSHLIGPNIKAGKNSVAEFVREIKSPTFVKSQAREKLIEFARKVGPVPTSMMAAGEAPKKKGKSWLKKKPETRKPRRKTARRRAGARS